MEDEKKYTIEELEEKLTDREKEFCKQRLLTGCSAKAARIAGYAENSARQIGYENLTKPYIKQYIEHLKTDVEAVTGITKELCLNELKKMATSNISDLHETWITKKQFEDLTEDQKAGIQEITSDVKKVVNDEGETVIQEYVKVKMHDKKGALQEIIKVMGYQANSKLDISNPDGSLKPGNTYVLSYGDVHESDDSDEEEDK